MCSELGLIKCVISLKTSNHAFVDTCLALCIIDCACSDSIASVMRNSGCEVPEWMLQLKKTSKYSNELSTSSSGPCNSCVHLKESS